MEGTLDAGSIPAYSIFQNKTAIINNLSDCPEYVLDFCKCGSEVGCSLKRPTSQMENYLYVFEYPLRFFNN